jgi:hypothetical protein
LDQAAGSALDAWAYVHNPFNRISGAIPEGDGSGGGGVGSAKHPLFSRQLSTPKLGKNFPYSGLRGQEGGVGAVKESDSLHPDPLFPEDLRQGRVQAPSMIDLMHQVNI